MVLKIFCLHDSAFVSPLLYESWLYLLASIDSGFSAEKGFCVKERF